MWVQKGIFVIHAYLVDYSRISSKTPASRNLYEYKYPLVKEILSENVTFVVRKYFAKLFFPVDYEHETQFTVILLNVNQ